MIAAQIHALAATAHALGGADVLEIVYQVRCQKVAALLRCEELVANAPPSRRHLYQAMVREHTVAIETLDDVLREAGAL